MTRIVFIASFLALVALGLSAVRAAEQGQPADGRQTTDQKQGPGQAEWRYTFHDGAWWYWLPTGRWVYWREGRWNASDAGDFTSPGGAAAAGRKGSAEAGRAANGSDIRPFYGRAASDLDRRRPEANNEVGPFYGHALPSEVFGGWRARRSRR